MAFMFDLQDLHDQLDRAEGEISAAKQKNRETEQELHVTRKELAEVRGGPGRNTAPFS